MNPIFKWIKNGNSFEVAKWITRNPDSLEIKYNEFTPLFWAVFHEKITCVSFLASSGGNVNVFHPSLKSTPLHFSVFKSKPKFVKILLENAGNYLKQDGSGLSPIRLLTNSETSKSIKNVGTLLRVFENHLSKELGLKLHINFKCSKKKCISDPIVGPRYYCVGTENYNLCENCFFKLPENRRNQYNWEVHTTEGVIEVLKGSSTLVQTVIPLRKARSKKIMRKFKMINLNKRKFLAELKELIGSHDPKSRVKEAALRYINSVEIEENSAKNTSKMKQSSKINRIDPNSEIIEKEQEEEERERNMLKKAMIKMSSVELLDPIGEGGMGKVYAGKWNDEGGGIDVAVKVITLVNPLETSDLSEFLAMYKCRSLMVLRVCGFCVSEDKMKLWIVMEKMHSNLFKYLRKNSQKKMEMGEKLQLMKKVTQCIHYLHTDKELQLIHRDVKSLNYLVSEDGKNIRVTDFGLVKSRGMSKNVVESKGAKGTLQWMAPELFNFRAEYSFKSDVYALGMVFYEILTSKYPFQIEFRRGDLNNHNFASAIKRGTRPVFEDEKLESSAIVSRLVKKCWKTDPKDRLSTSEILEEIARLERVENPNKEEEELNTNAYVM